MLKEAFKQDSAFSLGDLHNFGQQVSLHKNGLIHKPRTLFWESLLLSKNNFRQHVENLFLQAGREMPFQTLPLLHFEFENQLYVGYVRPLKVDYVRDLSIQDFANIGRFSALAVFLGISDLNRSNLFIGRVEDGNFVCTPVDIETIFNQLELLSQTELFPNKTLSKNQAGLSQLFLAISNHYLPEVLAAVVHGYLETLTFLFEHSKSIFNFLLTETPSLKIPIRVLLRDTRLYVQLLEEGITKIPLDTELLDCEKEQLARQEVPYYFRFINNPTIYYFKEPEKPEISTATHLIERFKIIEPLPIHEKGPPHQHIKTLVEGGALQIARSVPIHGHLLKAKFKNLSLQFNKTEIDLKWGNKIWVSCKRD